jgi:archaeosortase B (VPXXXP-CTERM-specific)
MIATLRRWYRSHDVLVRFYLLFAYLVALLYLGLHLETSHVLLAQSFPAFTASCVGVALTLLGQTVTVTGQTVSVQGGMAFEIIYQCSGLFLMAIYAAAVLAYPARVREKGLGLLFGLPLLFLANVVRLALLGIVGRFFPQYFDLSHEYLWQGIFIVFVLLLWTLWRDHLVAASGPLEIAE